MPSSTRKRLRQRRVLAFVWAIIRHGWAITATFLGSFLLSVPGWIDPLLSYAQKQELNRWTTVSPHTYRYLAIAFFAAGLLYASFLAWNEERDEVERLATELARANAGNEETQAMHELASEMRQSRTHNRLSQSVQRAMESARAQEHAERASKLAAFSKRGKELYEMKLTENEHFESWKLSVEGWHRDVIANLNDAESAMFDAPISNALEAVGHSGALNRVHGDMRGRILVWLERINLILSR